ncbi:MAG TPA: CbtA family protein [Streptosporangiaceae bacterium]|nr:CbtA family protein [Streptosporangiaceae bacterium]
MLMRTLLVRGMLAGLAAAALALIFAWILGEPQIGHAIAFEDQQARLAGAAPAPELVSRTVQETFGLAVAVGLVGLALGGLFSIAFAICYGRIGRFGPRATSALVAAGAFVAVELVPFLKYPANPPSVGNPATIGHRTVLYFTMIAIGVAAAIATIQLGRRLAPRFGNWNASLLAAAAFIALVTIAYLALPAVNEVPRDFPAVVLWRFRLASLGTQAVLWATLGLLFGALTERSLATARQRSGQAPAARA